ncbi:MAG: hypothetical protein ABDK94_06025 [Atribacterota bacterium]
MGSRIRERKTFFPVKSLLKRMAMIRPIKIESTVETSIKIKVFLRACQKSGWENTLT